MSEGARARASVSLLTKIARNPRPAGRVGGRREGGREGREGAAASKPSGIALTKPKLSTD